MSPKTSPPWQPWAPPDPCPDPAIQDSPSPPEHTVSPEAGVGPPRPPLHGDRARRALPCLARGPAGRRGLAPRATRLDQWERAQRGSAVRAAGAENPARASGSARRAREAGARYPGGPERARDAPRPRRRAAASGPDGPPDPYPGADPALLHLGRGGAALRAREGAVARDRPEGVQHQRVHPPAPGGLPGHQPLRGPGCYGERGRTRAREEAGPGACPRRFRALGRKFGVAD